MPDELAAIIEKRTTLDEAYKQHAAHQSMTTYLTDWEEAYAILGRRIERLRLWRDVRIGQSERGTWPAAESVVPRGTLALVSKAGVVVVAASFRLGNPDDLNEAVRFVNEDRRRSDRVARYVDGEAIRVGHPAPQRSGIDGDCNVCDGDHDPLDSHGSSA